MPTVNSKALVDQIIAKNGRYADDPPVVKIVEYDNAYGGVGYGLVYEGQNPNSYAPSQYVRNPRTIFERR